MNIDDVWNQLDNEWKEIFFLNLKIQSSPMKEQCSIWQSPIEKYKLITGNEFINLDKFKLEAIPDKIDIYSSNIKNLSKLESITNLREFYCGATMIEDLTALRNNKNLERLCCYNTPLKNLNGLEQLTSIKRLCISRTKVSDISPLRNFLKLEKLAMYKTRVTDLSPIENLINLLKLNINHTNINSLKPLYKLKSLTELHCYKSKVTRIEIDNFLKINPTCKVIIDYEQSELEYDDFV